MIPGRYSTFDHTSGLPAVVAEGITIVTPKANKEFLRTALAEPWTLARNSMSKSGKKPVIEGFKGDKSVFQDATRKFEVHVIKAPPSRRRPRRAHPPQEKVLVHADMFSLRPGNDPVPNPPVISTMVFVDNIERLHLEPERVMSIHNLNPDHLTTVGEIKVPLGRK
jgi:hypothetical protein